MADVAWFDSLLGAFVPPLPPHHRSPPWTWRASAGTAPSSSDTHLGTRGCKAEALADFLAHNDGTTLFPVGDIVDGWQMKRRWFWTEAQSWVVAEILRKVDTGTGVIFARQS